jgi:hypothetical protein
MSAERRIAENPFLVLGLAADASRVEVEREAQKLLGMLELGLAAATTYATPIGTRVRTAELVRTAAATLRDPERRLAAEVWARGMAAMGTGTGTGTDSGTDAATGTGTGTDSGTDSATGTGAGWPGALRALGWSRR